MLEHDLLERFWNFNIQIAWTQTGVVMGNLSVNYEFREGFTQTMDRVLLFNQRMCAPNDVELKRTDLEEAYKSVFTVHSSS